MKLVKKIKKKILNPSELQLRLLSTMDAKIWAKEFCKATGFKDVDWARAWFANAIMTAYDMGRSRPQNVVLTVSKELSKKPRDYQAPRWKVE
jgi:hypothetical protein